VRDGQSMRYQYAGRLRAGDYVYLFISSRYPRLLDRLFASPEPGGGDIAADLNPHSLEVLTDCRLEPVLGSVKPGETVQLERQGYFCVDPDAAPGRPVFNRTVGLRDSWARIQAAAG
jgi:glutaminyl-tRNA synthetase